VKDCRHLSRRLEGDLLAVGEQIVQVPPKLMAHARYAARSYGKSDPTDAPRWRGQRCASRVCRQRSWTGCGCRSITPRTWSLRGPG
jgi:transposase